MPDNLQPVVSAQPSQQQSPPPPRVAPGPVFGPIDALADKTPVWQPQPGPTGNYALPIAPDSLPDTGAGVTPGQGGLGTMLGNAAGWLVNAPGSGGPLAPKAPSPTDAGAAPAATQQVAPTPETAAGALTKAGHTADTHATNETHPSTHTLEQYVAMNRHLTPRDLQAMAAYLPPQGAHEQIMQDVRAGFQGKLKKDLEQAAQLRAAGKTKEAAELEQNAASKHLEDLKSFAGVVASPYATANAYGFGGGAPPPKP